MKVFEQQEVRTQIAADKAAKSAARLAKRQEKQRLASKSSTRGGSVYAADSVAKASKVVAANAPTSDQHR